MWRPLPIGSSSHPFPAVASRVSVPVWYSLSFAIVVTAMRTKQIPRATNLILDTIHSPGLNEPEIQLRRAAALYTPASLQSTEHIVRFRRRGFRVAAVSCRRRSWEHPRRRVENPQLHPTHQFACGISPCLRASVV